MPEEERQRLQNASNADLAGRASVEVLARSDDSALLLDHCREVMTTILSFAGTEWPALETWRVELPRWFVSACAPEQTAEEAERWLAWWRTLPPEEQIAVEEAQPWALSDWLEWLRPSERTWYWLGARTIDPQTLIIWLDTPGSPSPTGALEWLLKAGGANEVFVE